MNDPVDAALKAITDHFVRSRDFNGILAARLATDLRLSWPSLLPEVDRLVSAEQVSIAFYRLQDNPHVLRLPPPDIPRQREVLRSEPPEQFCLYPTPAVLTQRPDLAAFSERPFTKRLALGEPQLTPVFFELAVLESYYRDPRYLFHYNDMGGSTSIGDAAYRSPDVPDRDKVLLQTFGIAYDDRRSRVVVVYLRYLSDLSPEHQQIWKARAIENPCTMNSDYERATLYGAWPEHYSAYEALLTEMAEINKLSTFIGKLPLFRDDFSSGRPTGFHPMLRPTARSFHEALHLLDKMLSENLNREFFRHDVSLEEQVQRDDGKVQVVQLGTLQLLGNWLSTHYRRADGVDASDEILAPLRKVRNLRQRPAHAIDEDRFDISLPGQQDALIAEVLRAFQKLRWVLMSHPNTRGTYETPDWLDGDKIVIY